MMFLSLLCVVLAGVLVARAYRPASRVESLLVCFLSSSAIVVLLAFVLSFFRLLDSRAGWVGSSCAVLALLALPIVASRQLRQRCLHLGIRPDLWAPLRRLPPRRGAILVLWLLGGTVGLVAIINLIFITRLQPATLDVLKYHLARIGYFVQQGSLDYFAPNYWAQIVHPKVSAILMLYTYLLTGRESLASLVQFLAYWICILAVYGIAREAGAPRRGSVFAALVFGLLTICIAEASTAQNDLLLAAYAGCLIYALLRYRASGHGRTLVFAALAWALGIGVKLAFVTLLPSLLLVTLWPWRSRTRMSFARRHHWGIGVASIVATTACIILPAGYWDNLRHFGHPAGPWQLRVLHSYERRAPARVAVLGAQNVLRYSSDFLQMDGLGPVPGSFTLQAGITALPRAVLTACRLDLTASAELRGSFRYVRNLYASENTSSWGIWGFLLIWPVVFFTVLRPASPAARSLGVAALTFVLVQCYAGPYDSWRGRYFLAGALFATPCLAWLPIPPRRGWARACLLLVTGVGCVSALCAATWRQDAFLFPAGTRDNVFLKAFTPESTPQLTRIKQLVRQVPSLANPLVKFESLVPPDAVVAVDVSKPIPEYPFFGERFSRRLVPLFPFGANDLPAPVSYTNSPHLPLPAAADFLLCTPDSPHHTATDLCLLWNDPMFGTLFLRQLR